MIKKLRLRFILAALLSVLFVLSCTMLIINGLDYSSMESHAQTTLANINDVGTDEYSYYMNPNRPMNRDDGFLREHYFLVDFDSNGEVTRTNFMHIFSINEEEGVEMAKKVYAKESKTGSSGNFRYQKREKEDKLTIAFLDITEKVNSFNNSLVTSLTVSGISYGAFAVIIVLASLIAFRNSAESYRKQKAFITNASHELKTPLTIISTDLEIIEMDYGQNEWSESIRDQVNRLTTMTNQLVTLSKLGEDSSNYQFETISLSELAKACIDSFLPSFQKRGLSFKQEIGEQIIMRGSKNLLNELFYIFFDNALKYAKDNGEVGVKIEPNKGKINLTFYNDIDDDEIDTSQLMERFYRSPNAKKEGTGIGLSIAKEIIEHHKGKINISIKNNKIIFAIVFPSKMKGKK